MCCLILSSEEHQQLYEQHCSNGLYIAEETVTMHGDLHGIYDLLLCENIVHTLAPGMSHMHAQIISSL